MPLGSLLDYSFILCGGHCRVLISAVDASDSDLKLVFFNNCLFNGDSKYREGEFSWSNENLRKEQKKTQTELL